MAGLNKGRDRNTEPFFDKTYKEPHKLQEPTVCTDCGAVYHKGRWSWGDRPAGASEARCPACTRLHDHDPAGFVKLRGDFLREHRAEILNLAHNIETREKAEHPLKRIMAVEHEDDGGLLITTTDTHLAKSIGDGIHHAYEGHLDYKFAEELNNLHVLWER